VIQTHSKRKCTCLKIKSLALHTHVISSPLHINPQTSPHVSNCLLTYCDNHCTPLNPSAAAARCRNVQGALPAGWCHHSECACLLLAQASSWQRCLNLGKTGCAPSRTLRFPGRAVPWPTAPAATEPQRQGVHTLHGDLWLNPYEMGRGMQDANHTVKWHRVHTPFHNLAGNKAAVTVTKRCYGNQHNRGAYALCLHCGSRQQCTAHVQDHQLYGRQAQHGQCTHTPCPCDKLGSCLQALALSTPPYAYPKRHTSRNVHKEPKPVKSFTHAYMHACQTTSTHVT
jgi:hypothetical protein